MINQRQSICEIIDENIFHCHWTFGIKPVGNEFIKNYFMFFRLERNGFRIERCWSKLEFKLLTKEQFIEQIRALEDELISEVTSMAYSLATTPQGLEVMAVGHWDTESFSDGINRIFGKPYLGRR